MLLHNLKTQCVTKQLIPRNPKPNCLCYFKTLISKVICNLECTRIFIDSQVFFPIFAIFSENEELKEQLAQLAATKVRMIA